MLLIKVLPHMGHTFIWNVELVLSIKGKLEFTFNNMPTIYGLVIQNQCEHAIAIGATSFSIYVIKLWLTWLGIHLAISYFQVYNVWVESNSTITIPRISGKRDLNYIYLHNILLMWQILTHSFFSFLYFLGGQSSHWPSCPYWA